MLNLTAVVQNDRKALVIRDTTPLFSELVVAEGWGTDYDFADYIIAGTQTATLTVTKNHYDDTSETTVFDLTALGFFEGVTDQADLVYNLVIIDGVMQVIATSTFDADTAEVMPDGLYTLVYTLTTTGSDVIYTEIFLFKANAEAVLKTTALNLDDKVISSSNTDFVQLLNINVLEAMMFLVNNGDTTSDKTAILNMLEIINDETYEYYMD